MKEATIINYTRTIGINHICPGKLYEHITTAMLMNVNFTTYHQGSKSFALRKASCLRDQKAKGKIVHPQSGISFPHSLIINKLSLAVPQGRSLIPLYKCLPGLEGLFLLRNPPPQAQIKCVSSGKTPLMSLDADVASLAAVFPQHSIDMSPYHTRILHLCLPSLMGCTRAETTSCFL